MRCHSKKIANSEQRIADSERKLNAIRHTLYTKPAFTLGEIVIALAILALISSSVLVVIGRCAASAADSELRMRALEVARENMEALLSADSVKETVEYGQSDKYPEIEWQTIVETFYEPITARMWIRGVCSAEYNDTEGELQTVELTHWLTDLTREQLLQIMKNAEQEREDLTGELIETVEEAAEYAGVEPETIEQWLENGMLTTEDGSFVRKNLDIYRQNDGNPSPEDKQLQVKSIADLRKPTTEQEAGGQDGLQDEIDPKTGLTYGELEEMDFSEIWELLKSQQP
ncbi:MAG: type II secretion system protein [Planctomycetota bacterium]|jgi:type II secretory pathway pseudopilin PulG